VKINSLTKETEFILPVNATVNSIITRERYTEFWVEMEVHYAGASVRVVQRMPNPSSPNVPWTTISDIEMPLTAFDAYVRPSISITGGKLARVEVYTDGKLVRSELPVARVSPDVSSAFVELETKYGPDFRKKLELYRTAKWKWNDEIVAICEVDTGILCALIKDQAGNRHNVQIVELTDFTL
jgi:hypothetical protein